MNSRIDFHKELSKAPGLGTYKAGDKDRSAVYFQPPANVRMEFPCIIYTWSRARDLKANNFNYIFRRGYTVTVIDRDPDSKIPDWIVRNFRYVTFDRSFVVDNLHHFVFTIYY